MNHIHATLDNLALISLRVNLRRGAAPSTMEATLPQAAIAPGQAVILRATDGATLRELQQFRITRVDDLGDGRMRVHGADVRHEWSQRPVSASLNLAAGATLDLSTVLQRLFTAAGVPWPGMAVPPGIPRVACRGLALNRAIQQACASCGVSFTIDDAGNPVFAPADEAAPEPDVLRLIAQSSASVDQPAAVTGGAPLELVRITDWQPVLPGDGSANLPEGELHPLAQVLAAWGIDESRARKAALGEAGYDKLVGNTAPAGAKRLAILRRHAFRLFRAGGGPWLPVGGVNDDGTLAPPRLECAGTRPGDSAPPAPTDGFEAHTLEPVREGFEIDCARGVLSLARPPYVLGAGDATLQSRALVGPPHIALTLARPSAQSAFTLGDGPAISAPQLVAVYDGAAMLNRAALTAAARAMLGAAQAPVADHLLAGADGALALGTRAEVELRADEHGLTTRLIDWPQTREAVPDDPPAAHTPGAVAPLPSGLHQPINLYRAGPLVIRASGTAPEGESVLAAEAVARDPATSALELAHPGALAFPFFLESADAAHHGRWFFVAGVEAMPDGMLRVLAPDERHAQLQAAAFTQTRLQLPPGLRGLLVSLGDGPQFVDCGPLVADARGREPGACSNLVADLDGSRLSEIRRGGLQYLTVLALSPVHKRWVPALNLRDGNTQSDATCGRGLFAERDGRSLGRLGAHGQGGPILADAPGCEKHHYGTATEDGSYREVAGHLSTESFFKVPGDATHDAPLAFTPEPFAGGVPPWTPYEAQIKYDAAGTHRWNHATREGLWRIQYRLPFLPGIPPTWRPSIKPPDEPPPGEPPPEPPRYPSMILPPESVQPAISEYELWAPSHDWVPVPAEGDTGEEIPMLGPAISSAGWAGQVQRRPDPGLGGGVIFLPPGMPLPAAQQDSGARQTFVTLHPQVLLAWGLPHHSLGRVHSGWQAGLIENELVFTPVNEAAQPAPGVLRVAAEVAAHALELEPQEESPGAGHLWASEDGHAMWGSEQLATQSQLDALQAQIDELRDLIE